MAPPISRTISSDADLTHVAVPPLRSLVDWQAIIAGGTIAAGVSFLLMSFGSAVGLAISSPFASEGASAATIGTLAVLWFGFTHLYAFGVGGYVAGRLRAPAGDGADRDEVQFRDGISGLVVWASALIISAFIVASTAAGITGMAASGAAQAVGAAATSATQTTPSSDYVTDLFLRATTSAAAAPDAAPSTTAVATTSGQQTDSDARAEVGRILAMSVARGELTSDDKQNLASIIAARSAISQEDALTRVNNAVVKVDAAREDAKRRAQVVADAARETTSKAAFWATLIMMLTAMTTWYAAKLGGRHRDDRRFY